MARILTALYWTTTGVTATWMLGMGAASIAGVQLVHERIAQLGYPSYFPLLLGSAKLLGATALLLPVPRRLREWAYAGIAFELLAAMVSYSAIGASLQDRIAPLVLLLVAASSYGSWRRLADRGVDRAAAAAVPSIPDSRGLA